MPAYDHIAICSFDRADTLCAKKLAVLAGMRDVSLSDVSVLVPGPDQGALYREKLLAAGYGDVSVIDDMPLGLLGARNRMHSMFPAGARVISMDDDLKAIEELSHDGAKLVPLGRLNQAARAGFRAAHQAGALTWGVYPVRNAFFMSHIPTSDLRLVLGGMYGFVSEGDQAVVLEAPSKTDYAWTLAQFARHGAVVRLNHIALNTKVYEGEGGVSFERTVALEEESIALLEAKYPGLVARKNGTKTGYPEMRLVAGYRRKDT